MDRTFLIYFGLLALICLIAMRRPAAAVGAYLCTFGLEQWAQSQSGYFFVHASLTNLSTGCVLLFALAMQQVRGTPMFSGGMSATLWVLLTLLAWTAASLMWTIYDDALTRFKIYALPVVAYVFLVPLLIKNPRDLRSALLVLMVVGGAVLMLLVTTSTWESRHIILKQGAAIGSVIGNRGNPLATASMAGYVAIAALLLNFRGAGKFWLLLRWPLIALTLIVAFKSGSRGQLFAMVAAAIMFLPLSRRIKNLPGFVGICLGVGIMLMLATWAFDNYSSGDNRWDVENMMSTWQTSRGGTSTIVLQEWAAGGPLVWLIGLGHAGSFATEIAYYPHLVMVETLAELGFVGFALLWVFVIVTYLSYFKLHKAVRDDPVIRGTCAAAAAIFMFEIILSFKQGTLLSNGIAFSFAIILANLYRWSRTPEAAAELQSAAVSSGPTTNAAATAFAAPNFDSGGQPSFEPRAERKPRRRVEPIFLGDQRPTQAGF